MKNQQPPNTPEKSANNLLSYLDCNTTQWTHVSCNQLTINGQAVLVRTTSENTCMCVELYHEDNKAKWVKSWGLNTPAKYIVLLMGAKCYWYNVAKLKTLVSEGITNGSLTLVNNSLTTRSNNRPSSNVMNVWVPLLNNSLLLSHTLEDKVNLDKYIKE